MYCSVFSARVRCSAEVQNFCKLLKQNILPLRLMRINFSVAAANQYA